MSAHGGPDIVEDGLVLTLDAANIKSFKGEPTTNFLNNPLSPTSWSHLRDPNYGFISDEFFTYNGPLGNNIPAYRRTLSGVDFRSNRFDVPWTAHTSANLSQSITTSIYVRCLNPSSSTRFNLNFQGLNSSNSRVDTSTSIPVGSDWVRISNTRILSESGFVSLVSFGMKHYFNGDDTVRTWEVMMPQVEQKPYATPFVNGTRGTTVATGGGWADRSGNDNHGELVNGLTYDDDNLGSLVFDGVDDYIQINNEPSLQITSDITIDFWLYVTAQVGGQGVITKGPFSSDYDYMVYLTSNSTLISFYKKLQRNQREIRIIIMATLYSPKIVTDGLVLALDAANTNSFRGEPTTNLLSQPTNISNWSKQQTTVDATPSFFREIDGNLIPFYKVTSTVITDPFIILTTAVGNISNRTFTYSVYLCTDPGQPTTSIQLFTYGNVPSFEGSSVTSATVTITSEPTRYKLTSTYGAGFNSTSLANRVDLNQATLGYLYVGGAQLEEKAYETRFVAGTRGTTVATGGGWVDRSGNSNHGELVNGPTYNSSNLGSISFDGSNDRVITSTVALYENNMTWEGWANRESSVNDYNMFMGQFLPYFAFRSNNEFHFSNSISGTQRNLYSTGITVQNNIWYHLAFTTEYDGTNTLMKIYVNGIFNNSASFLGNQSTPGSFNLTVGDGRNTSTWYPFDGKVSNVKVYNRTLTAAEVLQNYNATKGRFGL
jgi:hypothetical protein